MLYNVYWYYTTYISPLIHILFLYHVLAAPHHVSITPLPFPSPATKTVSFRRMVEPLHSFVVMNTLALHLFLQPITADLEFQDRNPFLLYKANADIFGIWFLDRDDCHRVRATLSALTEGARLRKAKREHSKLLLQQQVKTSFKAIQKIAIQKMKLTFC